MEYPTVPGQSERLATRIQNLLSYKYFDYFECKYHNRQK